MRLPRVTIQEIDNFLSIPWPNDRLYLNSQQNREGKKIDDIDSFLLHTEGELIQNKKKATNDIVKTSNIELTLEQLKKTEKRLLTATRILNTAINFQRLLKPENTSITKRFQSRTAKIFLGVGKKDRHYIYEIVSVMSIIINLLKSSIEYYKIIICDCLDYKFTTNELTKEENEEFKKCSKLTSDKSILHPNSFFEKNVIMNPEIEITDSAGEKIEVALSTPVIEENILLHPKAEKEYVYNLETLIRKGYPLAQVNENDSSDNHKYDDTYQLREAHANYIKPVEEYNPHYNYQYGGHLKIHKKNLKTKRKKRNDNMSTKRRIR